MVEATSEQRRVAFASIYEEGYWGEVSRSGAGSTIHATRVTRRLIRKVVSEMRITHIVDVACGDFAWMPVLLGELDGAVGYTGCDIVPSLIAQNARDHPLRSFRTLDFVADEIPPGDLILCRDALQHLPVRDIKKALANFSRSGARYLLATTHLRRFGFRNGRNIRPGRCRDRNLLMPPFSLPDPLVIYCEQYPGPQEKFLGLWELPF